MIVLRIPAPQYRTLPPPSTGSSKLGFFYAAAGQVPPELFDWREVNPREVNPGNAVWKAIHGTLTEEPERFFERNRGLTISADEVDYDDKRRAVVIKLADPKIHGLVDGGHTLHAILEVQKNPPEDWPAQVFIKVITGVEPDQIAEIAGGLNRSQAVDLKSLENLKEHFAQLQKVLAGEPFADKIGYKMNHDKPVDVREVLYYLAVFDCEEYDGNKHPTQLFGRKEGIVRKFADQAAKRAGAGDSFKILISRAPDILRLRDLIELRSVTEYDNIGYYKAGKRERIKSKKHRKNLLYFLNRQCDGKVPLGWIMPMLGAFRANVEWNGPTDSFTWRVPNEALLDICLDRLVAGIIEVHQRENSRPEHVGRSAMAWRICYETVKNSILQYQLNEATKGASVHHSTPKHEGKPRPTAEA